MKTTIRDIAKEAGVSIATVSHTLNNTRYVKKETMERIKKIVAKYNYQPNFVGKSIRSKKTKIIGILTPYLREQSFNEVLLGMEGISSKAGYFLNVLDVKNFVKNTGIMNIIDSNIFDGLIIGGAVSLDIQKSKKILKDIEKRGIPVVNAENTFDFKEFPLININNYSGGRIVAETLLAHNHKDIGEILFKSDFSYSRERKQGFLDSLKKKNCRVKFSLEIPFEPEKIMDNLELNKTTIFDNKVSAIFAHSDEIAMNFIKLLNKFSIKVPEDISVIGFGNISFCELFIPGLTTIDHRFYEIGEIAAKNLLEILNGHDPEKNNIMLDPFLVERDSIKGI